ncbi:hypothetical protein BJ546DRAFT_1057066 [Cryomyces antarcticus]|uniref:SMP domain-containing protein n=1 Tax=Cryomyces antarcticus TaxID=329879 RepID=A0ABR0M8G3_9PEZI|nr:hypothetical protein LTR39_001232 [Cryomyces antarcticus]KAK5020057.1 hypothetical protein LTR60_000878 [Cryomyces antarcticus]KAK5293329.1 hypothetical protein LTR16_001590 [Cryomyces antarcticus]
MPRHGSRASDNAIEAGKTLIHGAGENDAPTSSGVDRSHKAAAPPPPEKGEAIEGLHASGGGSQAAEIGDTGQGKGEQEAFVDKGS